MNPTIQYLAKWLDEQITANPFGEAGVKIIMHRGTLSRFEKTETVKIKPEPEQPAEISSNTVRL